MIKQPFQPATAHLLVFKPFDLYRSCPTPSYAPEYLFIFARIRWEIVYSITIAYPIPHLDDRFTVRKHC